MAWGQNVPSRWLAGQGHFASNQVAPMKLKEAAGIVVRHVMATKLVADLIARFPDPYQARL